MNLNETIRMSDEKLIVYLMMLTPFIDLLNGVFEEILSINISPGLLIRSIILVVIMYIYIIKEEKT